MPNQRYKQIYLAGLLEGEFPAIKNNIGFLTGQELEQWRRLGIYLYNPRMEAGFEYALFASLVNRAEDKLILSHPSIEITASKDELLPSFFFNALNIQTGGTRLFRLKVRNSLLPRRAMLWLIVFGTD